MLITEDDALKRNLLYHFSQGHLEFEREDKLFVQRISNVWID